MPHLYQEPLQKQFSSKSRGIRMWFSRKESGSRDMDSIVSVLPLLALCVLKISVLLLTESTSLACSFMFFCGPRLLKKKVKMVLSMVLLPQRNQPAKEMLIKLFLIWNHFNLEHVKVTTIQTRPKGRSICSL